MYNNLYRKYRPMNFDELIGQEHVIKYFKNTIKKDEISHAYIFSGPRGTGKTTTARILSKIVNCKNPNEYNPCNECENCISINKNSFIDVIEMDAASNRGIDEIRNIRESANYKPVHGKYKVYIIDEFHMLTREAFNALLKTLEEPPRHVIFILATTNLEKVPETIISRAQIINFKNLANDDIVDGLKKIAELENIEYELEALQIIAKKAKGGMRDAISMFEQVEKFGASKITLQETLDILGLFDESFVSNFIDIVYSSKIDEFLKKSEELFSSGKDPEILVEQSLEFLFNKLSKDYSDNSIFLMKILNELLKDLKYSENKRLIFDVEILDFMSKKMKNEQISYSGTPTTTLERQNSQRQKEDIKKFEDPLLKKILNYFSDPHEKKSNLAIYFALLSSTPKIDKDKIDFTFSSDQKLAYEILKKYIDELKVDIYLLIDESYDIAISFADSQNENLDTSQQNKLFEEKRLF